MSNDIASDISVRDEQRVEHAQHNPIIGFVAFLAVFAAFAAVFVQVTRHDVAAVAEMGIVALVCGALSMMMAHFER
jgi:hypothetical protein